MFLFLDTIQSSTPIAAKNSTLTRTTSENASTTPSWKKENLASLYKYHKSWMPIKSSKTTKMTWASGFTSKGEALSPKKWRKSWACLRLTSLLRNTRLTVTNQKGNSKSHHLIMNLSEISWQWLKLRTEKWIMSTLNSSKNNFQTNSQSPIGSMSRSAETGLAYFCPAVILTCSSEPTCQLFKPIVH